MHSIRYTDAAVYDLDLIFDYIADDRRDDALALLQRIESGILRLGAMPLLGVALPTTDRSVARPGYRYLAVHPYLIFYRVEEDAVVVGRVLHSRQNWLRILFERDAE